MPPKRAPPTLAGPAPERMSTRGRPRAVRPGDGDGDGDAPLPLPNQDNPIMLTEFAREVTGQFADVDAALQANTHQLNDMTVLLNELRQHLTASPNLPRDHGPAVGAVPNPGNTLPAEQHDVLSRWPWVDRSLVENIANGTFDIYDLPKLHRDEFLRNRHIAKTVDGVTYPLSGGRPHIVQAKTKLQSSFKDYGTFQSAWMVYVSIRTSYAPERGPGLAIWTEPVAFHSTLQYEFTTVVNYVVAYFQAHQNSSPESWFHVDSELHSEHFGNAAQRAVNTLRSLPIQSSSKAFANKAITSTPITEEVCKNWNKNVCKVLERTGNKCLRKHVCGICHDPKHIESSCTKTGPA